MAVMVVMDSGNPPVNTIQTTKVAIEHSRTVISLRLHLLTMTVMAVHITRAVDTSRLRAVMGPTERRGRNVGMEEDLLVTVMDAEVKDMVRVGTTEEVVATTEVVIRGIREVEVMVGTQVVITGEDRRLRQKSDSMLELYISWGTKV